MTTINNKKNVLLVIRHPVGGIKTYIKYVFKDAYFKNYNVSVILPNDKANSQFLHLQDDCVDIKCIECENSTKSLFMTIFSTVRSADIDLIHSHGFTSGACAAVFARLFGIPHLLTSHDVLQDSQFTGIKGKLKKSVLTLLFKRINIIQSVSEDAGNNLKMMLPAVETSRMITIFNGINLKQFDDSESRALKRELELDTRHFVIGFLGRFMSQKGFKYLIDAIALLKEDADLPNIPIVVAIGSGGFIREEKQLIADRQLQEHFRFLDAVNNIGPSIRDMDVVAIPSLWEACPLLPMEVLVSGVPLIASDCIGLREVIEGSPAFRVRARSAEDLAAAIKKCMSDNRKDEFRNYRERARERFDAGNTSTALLEVYNQLTKAE